MFEVDAGPFPNTLLAFTFTSKIVEGGHDDDEASNT